MRKAVIISVVFFLGLGLSQPGGFFRCHDLRSMYEQCSVEDHDISPLDFVFEHLLNLESIVNILEGEHDYHHGDHPHEPFQAAQSLAQVMTTPPDYRQFDVFNQVLFPLQEKVHFVDKASLYLSCFSADIFRPPIVS